LYSEPEGTVAIPANLILIQSDNHSRKILGCYGHQIVKTPTLDKLASRGLRFANAYSASPLCVPARAAMATGRFPHQTGYWDNAIAYDARIPSWMHRVRDQGHTVAGIGKFHYRGSDQDNGFSEEFLSMHLHGGRGAIRNLLRGFDNELPAADDARWDLYAKRSGPGDSHYQDYDRQITRRATDWLREHTAPSLKPWILVIGYACPHPPFAAPQRLFDLYPEDRMPLPLRFGPGDRPEHPAARHKRWIERTHDMTDERILRRIAAAYFALVTYLDENIAEIMRVVEELGLLATTRIIYTSDHGELFGAQGLLGKSSLYEGSVGVPLILCGPGIPENQVADELVSHVDLFPTVVDAVGARVLSADAGLRGHSFFDAVNRPERSRVAFAEYHAQSSKAGQFMLRDGDLKLIYHVGMPAQLFDLSHDPGEIHDLVEEGRDGGNMRALQTKLRAICDPEQVDARAKSDQRLMADHWGGPAKLQGEDVILFTPPPGVSSQDAWAPGRDKPV
jgi:choline-sulfatase